jgi:hypothetical protein
MPASSSQNTDRMMPAWGPLKVAWAAHAATLGVLPSRLADGAGDTSVSAPLVLISIRVDRKGEKGLARSILRRVADYRPSCGAEKSWCVHQSGSLSSTVFVHPWKADGRQDSGRDPAAKSPGQHCC